ncbi:MAG: hypothetical protein ACOCUW_02130 [Gemmatimonadota bacterium]
MFREFRRAWRQAVDNFWQELDADSGTDAVYREVARVRNQLEELESEIGETRQRLSHEREQVTVCERRERMAREIDDGETARIAAEYRDRHWERASVLERKLDALEAERRLCRRDLGEMERALQEGRDRAARAELADLDRHPSEGEFRNLEESERTQSAEERLEELKKRMGK